MHAAVLHTVGEFPRYEEFPEPVAAAGEVVVEVSAAALKPAAATSSLRLSGIEKVKWLGATARSAMAP